MSRFKKPAPLASLLRGVVDDLGLTDRLDDTRIEEAWRKLAGPAAERVTSRVRMQDGRLTVYLNDATWRHALHAEREAWRLRINEAVGRNAVQEILFR